MATEAKQNELAERLASAVGHFLFEMNSRPWTEEVCELRNSEAASKLSLIYERYLAARPADAKWPEVA